MIINGAHKNTAKVIGVGGIIPVLVEIIVRDSAKEAQVFKNFISKG
jgi:hypothetical protein